MNRKTGIIIGSVLVGGVAVYVGANSIRKRSMIKKIEKKIETGEDKSGYDSLSSSPAFNPNYMTSVRNPNLLSESAVRKMAKDIKDAKGAIWDNEGEVVGIYKSLSNKAQASQLAHQFNRMYSKNLYEYLRTFIDEDEGWSEINEAIASMKDK